MNPEKRGNPPFEPSSYAAGLERRVKRLTAWANDATEATRMLLDGNDADKAFGLAWWRRHLDQPQVVASADTRPKGGDSTEIEAPFTSGAVPQADAQPPAHKKEDK